MNNSSNSPAPNSLDEILKELEQKFAPDSEKSDSTKRSRHRNKRLPLQTVVGFAVFMLVALGGAAGYYLTNFTTLDTRQQAQVSSLGCEISVTYQPDGPVNVSGRAQVGFTNPFMTNGWIFNHFSFESVDRSIVNVELYPLTSGNCARGYCTYAIGQRPGRTRVRGVVYGKRCPSCAVEQACAAQVSVNVEQLSPVCENKLTFDSLPNGNPPADQLEITDQFSETTGFSFSIQPQLATTQSIRNACSSLQGPRIALAGPPRTAFLGPDSGPNQDDNTYPYDRSQSPFLTDNTILGQYSCPVRVDIAPENRGNYFEFEIIDISPGETYVVNAYGTNNQLLANRSTAAFMGNKMNFNGKSFAVRLNTDQPIAYVDIIPQGLKQTDESRGGWGMAYDNFCFNPTPTNTPSPTPTSTPTPTNTPTPTSTPTPTITNTPTVTLTNTPIPTTTPAGVCLSISLNNLTQSSGQPQFGDLVNLTCGEVPGTPHYGFRIIRPAGNEVVVGASAPGSNVSSNFFLNQSGAYIAQCRLCNGTAPSSCQEWESIDL